MLWSLGILALVCGIPMILYAEAEPEEDLSDNEVCLDCHIDEEHLGTIEVAGANIHDPTDGSIIVEDHALFSCIDCHTDIEEIPHREDITRTVDCLCCHETTPE